MERIIVTIERAGEAQTRDIEITADVPVHHIAPLLAEALGWHFDESGPTCAYAIEAHPPGRRLHPDETLAQCQVWDGARLVLHRRSAQSAPSAKPDPPAGAPPERPHSAPQASPVAGWTTLGVPEQPRAVPPPADAPQPGGSFAWKPLDEDDNN